MFKRWWIKKKNLETKDCSSEMILWVLKQRKVCFWEVVWIISNKIIIIIRNFNTSRKKKGTFNDVRYFQVLPLYDPFEQFPYSLIGKFKLIDYYHRSFKWPIWKVSINWSLVKSFHVFKINRNLLWSRRLGPTLCHNDDVEVVRCPLCYF